MEGAWHRLTDCYRRRLTADPLRERRLQVARQIGEATFLAYWKGEEWAVDLIDRDYVELTVLFERKSVRGGK